ncbi:toxic anion resistance protein, partial [Amycolatopsis sp. CA-126428]|uniref:toxic anion resistance protein n=1 Tax=Amycolatopsis sp. CA-126428 TaxID=2073158 RepID=UPI001E476C01
MALSPVDDPSRSASPHPNPLQCPARRWPGRPPVVTHRSESAHSGWTSRLARGRPAGGQSGGGARVRIGRAGGRRTERHRAEHRRQDPLAQLAVSAQGHLALDLVRKNNDELIRGVERAVST